MCFPFEDVPVGVTIGSDPGSRPIAFCWVLTTFSKSRPDSIRGSIRIGSFGSDCAITLKNTYIFIFFLPDLSSRV